jgi:hypothetical protein
VSRRELEVAMWIPSTAATLSILVLPSVLLLLLPLPLNVLFVLSLRKLILSLICSLLSAAVDVEVVLIFLYINMYALASLFLAYGLDTVRNVMKSGIRGMIITRSHNRKNDIIMMMHCDKYVQIKN